MKKYLLSKFIKNTCIVVIVGLILGVTTFKVINEHNQKIDLVESKFIIEKALDCLNQKKCSGSTITLKDLYEQGMLEKQVNRKTKEYYNEESYVEIKDSGNIFVIVP